MRAYESLWPTTSTACSPRTEQRSASFPPSEKRSVPVLRVRLRRYPENAIGHQVWQLGSCAHVRHVCDVSDLSITKALLPANPFAPSDSNNDAAKGRDIVTPQAPVQHASL